MKRYNVMLPFTGYAIVEVEARNKEEALEAAFEKADMRCVAGNGTDLGEWEFHEYVTRGNVCSALLSEALVEEAD